MPENLLTGEVAGMSLLTGEALGMSLLIGEAPGTSFLESISCASSKADAQFCVYDLHHSEFQAEMGQQQLLHSEL